MKERIKKIPAIGIGIANILFIISFMMDSSGLLYAALLAWLVGLVMLFIQNKNENKFKSVMYAILAACVLCIVAFLLLRR